MEPLADRSALACIAAVARWAVAVFARAVRWAWWVAVERVAALAVQFAVRAISVEPALQVQAVFVPVAGIYPGEVFHFVVLLV